jgi:hypothetical protein
VESYWPGGSLKPRLFPGIGSSLLTTRTIIGQENVLSYSCSSGQEEAMAKAENMLQLIGYPDWLPEETELDAYYE